MLPKERRKIMPEINCENMPREELVDALIDTFNIRKPIEAYLKWLEMPIEDLQLIYISENENYDDEDYFL